MSVKEVASRAQCWRASVTRALKLLLFDYVYVVTNDYYSSLNQLFKKLFTFYLFVALHASQTRASGLKFVYTPKHASWLNMAEIEINMMQKECLARNIGNREELEKELGVWCYQNNQEKRKIYWRFTRKKADKKLSKHYVS